MSGYDLCEIAFDAVTAAIDAQKIQGVDLVFVDRPDDARNREKTFILLFEGDSDYNSDGEDYDTIGVYGTALSVQVVAKEKAEAKRICFEAAQVVYLHFARLRFQDGVFHGVERISKDVGTPQQNKYENMYVATRSLRIFNQIEP